ncbi:MAG TPA: hypothetical protein VGS98_14255 [Thermoanaerobaculia bacterium]|jgi:uncharacterized repeat protein (TIGR01451 family)|nr:hypothetical protein [Thermoanaerobaculia bacterium]
MKNSRCLRLVFAWLPAALLLSTCPAQAIVRPKADSPLAQKQFRHPDLYIRQQGKAIAELPAALAAKATADLSALGGQDGYIDPRSGRWSLLIMSRPLISGSGATQQSAREAVLGYVTQFQTQLGVLPSEVGEPRVTVFDDGRVVQLHAQRVINGVPVRDAWLKTTLNSGNLVLMGTQNWATVALATQPVLTQNQAFERVQSHAGTALTLRGAPELVIVPLENGDDPNQVVIGNGVTYRLAWAVTAVAGSDNGTWEGLVDAQTGELLAFRDMNQYFTRQLKGGIFPVSNDGAGADGTEQPGFPMPFAYILGTDFVTNSSGMVSGIGINMSTDLTGPYVRMNDGCGEVAETSMCSNLDTGTSGGHDCVVPAGHSAGDTHASRTGFYELNRQIQGWRDRLPASATAQPWMNSQLSANMNIKSTCNAFWDGASVNFYRSGCSGDADPPECADQTFCGNTGEIAAVFDHEWGHGLDNNGTDDSISSPGEAIADIYGILRLTDSCFGRGFFASPGAQCGGYGSPCLSCSGVRDLDFARHECVDPLNPSPNSGKAWDITWINQVGYPVATPCSRNPVTDEVTVQQGGCVGFNFIQTGPCGQETHCEGNVPAQAVYDLFARDLQGFGGLTNYGFNTALEITTRLVAIAADNLSQWYTCNQGAGGCTTITGYNMFLAADDDDGNLNNGTPHKDAIFNAFNRHGIACALPQGSSAGCNGGPSAAPTLTATAGANSASLSWSAVTGAAKYQIYRTEGVKGCNFGKTPIGETTGLSFQDTGLRDGFPVLYTVLPIGSNAACVGRMATCQTVTPTAGTQGADLAISEVPNGVAISGAAPSDGDLFLDNCEQATLTFRVENGGPAPLTNVRVTGVELVGKPSSDVITPLPLAVAASMPGGCPQSVQASVTFRPQGLSANETLEVRITVAADGVAPRTRSFFITGTESSFQFFASKKFSFETDLEGWNLVDGTFTRMTPGANGTLNGLYSSSAVDAECDRIQSPDIRLSATSTLSLYNQYSTEPPQEPGGPYDRANVGLFVVGTGARTTVNPSAGHLYDIPAPASGGTCVTSGQAGWAGTSPFLSSDFSSAALSPASCVGVRCRLDIAYGTDSLVSGAGFDFDEVTVTNFDLQVADQASNTCAPLPPPGADVAVVKTGPATGKVGQAMTYTITVSNNGPLAANGVTVTDTMPKNTGFGSVSSTQGSCGPRPHSQLVVCDIGTMANAATATITLTLKPTKKGTFTNKATVASTSPNDPVSGNNTSSVNTAVSP